MFFVYVWCREPSIQTFLATYLALLQRSNNSVEEPQQQLSSTISSEMNDSKKSSHVQQQQRQRNRLFDQNRNISLLDVEDTEDKIIDDEDYHPSNYVSLLETSNQIDIISSPEFEHAESIYFSGSSQRSLFNFIYVPQHQQVVHRLIYDFNTLELKLLCKCIVFANRVLMWPVICDPWHHLWDFVIALYGQRTD